MTETHQQTIDWDEFWRTADTDDHESATPSAHHVREALADLITETGGIDSVADVGCGPGVVTFDLAERYPDADVVGYDAAEAILDENRERATGEGLENVSFERTVLPEFDPGRQFDLVLCYGTLAYVTESEQALQNMYDAVAPGGHLVLGYVNEFGAAQFRAQHAELEESDDPRRDPGEYGERFGLVMAEESTLSFDAIRNAVGTWPRSIWAVAEKPEKRWAWGHVPLVYVPKPE
ncbi:class I SAM-dependent methyltransferase [Haloarchaeobius litoreus]|uniref:Class I SAM-dependent methyltransferase n=1 Tax=Haloarchaeobius litoreus TaxID=755306 RepID=A0ABD6DFB4_9EURY|nr:class I SAM-dependent methyltransferase [Haloarchaeobius litoreus]